MRGGGHRLAGGDETRADIGEVGAHRLGGQHVAAGGLAAGQYDGKVIAQLAYLVHQRKGIDRAGVAAGAAGHGDHAIDAGFEGLLGMAAVGNVVQRHGAPAMDTFYGVTRCALGCEHHRHLVLLDQLQIAGIARVGGVDDEIDGPRRRAFPGILQPFHAVDHLVEPGVEFLAAARAVGGKAAHQALGAAGEGEGGVRDQEHRCGDGGDRHALDQLLHLGACHNLSS